MYSQGSIASFWQSLPGRLIILNGKKDEKNQVDRYGITWGRFELQENKHITKTWPPIAEPGVQSCQGKKIEPSAKATGVLAGCRTSTAGTFPKPVFSRMEIGNDRYCIGTEQTSEQYPYVTSMYNYVSVKQLCKRLEGKGAKQHFLPAAKTTTATKCNDCFEICHLDLFKAFKGYETVLD